MMCVKRAIRSLMRLADHEALDFPSIMFVSHLRKTKEVRRKWGRFKKAPLQYTVLLIYSFITLQAFMINYKHAGKPGSRMLIRGFPE